MKVKVIKESFTPDSTIIILGTPIGKFCGVANFNSKDDSFPPSRIVGGKIAELRAYILYFKKLKERKQFELKGVKRLKYAMPATKEGYKYVVNLYNTIKQEIAELDKKINEYRLMINDTIEGRAVYVRSRQGTKAGRKEALNKLGEAISALKTITKDKID